MNDTQFTAAGKLRHLLTLADLPRALLVELLDSAQDFCARPGAAVKRGDSLAGRTVANLFFEPSTRTRASFELAARRLGADVLNLNLDTSSAVKGETVLDTLRTLEAMNVDAFVVRHAQAGIPALLAANMQSHVSIVNAGEAHVSHPTQGLLDALTIRQHKPDFGELCVVIAGDIAHSRVASAAIQALGTLGVGELRLAGPPELLPDPGMQPGARQYHDFDAGLRDADVIMMLRIQKERMNRHAIPDEREYFRRYGLTPERLKLARPDAIVMHPGPINRGVEIDAAVADGPQSVIRSQVNNGVAVRMAVLNKLLGTDRT